MAGTFPAASAVSCAVKIRSASAPGSVASSVNAARASSAVPFASADSSVTAAAAGSVFPSKPAAAMRTVLLGSVVAF